MTDEESDDDPVTDGLTGDPVVFPEPEKPDVLISGEDPAAYGKSRKVTENGVEVTILNECVQYMGDDGRIITESLRDFTRKNIRSNYGTLESFLNSWRDAEKKCAIIDGMEAHGVFFAALEKEIGSAFDPFDLICHVAFEQPPLTRRERAENVRKRNYLTRYGQPPGKYADDGLLDLENPAIITLDPINRLGTAPEIVRAFGGKDAYKKAIHELTNQLYRSA